VRDDLGHTFGDIPKNSPVFSDRQQITECERTPLAANMPSSLQIASIAGDQLTTNIRMQSMEERISDAGGDCHKGTYELLLSASGRINPPRCISW
jgi:hypothetical protein